jgi:methionyl-tRNA formyltransferase
VRLICTVNNYLGWKALDYLRTKAEIVGVVVHPPERAKFQSEIVACATLAGAKVFAAPDLANRDALQKIGELKPELGMSVMFGYLLKKDFLDLLPRGCMNLHPGFLPYNRGAHPNVWSIVEKTPAGVTLHYVDEGIDTGDIVQQKAVPISCSDTGESLYHKLEISALELLRETWPAIESGGIRQVAQGRGEGTFHKQADLARIDEIHLDQSYKAEDLLNVLRARTFPPYPGAFFRHNGKKVHIRVQFEEAEEKAGE